MLQNDYFRFCATNNIHEGTATEYRSEYSRDYARVIHAPSFRRLQNKTQLFPGEESDFFRSRLTHSIEVSQIARSIAEKLKLENQDLDINPQVCEIAGLLHDIGHPPFGHNGERALDSCMHHYGGFEGNAQTLRIVTKLEKKEKPEEIIKGGKDQRVGLNLTARVLASIIKYDKVIPVVRDDKELEVQKGYYDTEKEIVSKIKDCLIGDPSFCGFKTIECGIMDLADDIAYSTYDVEDAFKAGFITPFDILSEDEEFYEDIARKLSTDGYKYTAGMCRTSLLNIFSSVWEEDIKDLEGLVKNDDYESNALKDMLSSYSRSKHLAQDGYLRTELTSRMVNMFINGVCVHINKEKPILSEVSFDKETFIRVNTLKSFSFFSIVNSSRLKVYENRGYEIIERIFNKLMGKQGYKFLPEDVKRLFLMVSDTLWRARVICDFIAGMTDRYALEFYERLFSENPHTIFKPL